MSRKSSKPSPRPPARPARGIPIVAFAAVLALAGVWVYSTSFDGVLVLDDSTGIAWNQSIRSLSPISRPLTPPASTTVSGRPVANLSFAINYALAPVDVRDVFSPDTAAGRGQARHAFLKNLWGYHLMNLLIHLAAALALMGIVRRTLLAPVFRDRFQASAAPLGFAVALLWTVHPLNTQAVTYLVQRVESLMGLFLLLTLYCAIRAADSHRWWWPAGAVIACALGMATKESMVVAPVVVALWYWLFASKPSRLQAFTTVFLFSTWLILLPLVLSAPRGHTAGFGVGVWTPWTYLLTQTGVIVHYLKLVFWPSPLAFSYGWPMAVSIGAVAPQLALMAILGALTVFAVVRRQPLGFAGACFFLMLAPSSSVVPVVTEVAAEHRMYLPGAAVVSLVVIGVYVLAERLLRLRGAPLATAGGIAVVGLGLALGVNTRARNLDYTSDERLWRDTVEKQPMSPRAQLGYGMDLIAGAQFVDAERHLREAVRLEDTNAAAHSSLGIALFAQRRYDDAIPQLERALELWPDNPDAHRALGQIHAMRNQQAPAVQHLSRVIAVAPDDAAALEPLVWILATSPDDALRNGPKAVELGERLARITGARTLGPLETLAAAYAEVGRFRDAVSVIDLAIATTPPPQAIAALQERRAIYAARAK